MSPSLDPKELSHDPRDPSPWLASYLDQSTPLEDGVKRAWLADAASGSRQYLLPLIRPLARTCIVLIQLLKIPLPRNWSASRALHSILARGMRRTLSPRANWLIMRHFHLGSQILAFIAANSGVKVQLSPLTPMDIDDLKEELFLKHDLNLYNFIINLNTALRANGSTLAPVPLDQVDFSMLEQPELHLADMPNGRLNAIDLQSAIEIFTPVYQLFLTDNDFWRASNSLQLDETIGIYCATILNSPEHLILLNNKHPLVPMSTLRAGYRLVLHGLSTEMLHCLLMQMKATQAQQRQGELSPEA
ncbi:DUF6999 family protein [Ottowia thiooxydans]|uniref:DUF6999 family protein n=1 Tax=Ottowia thiooxydans TaxID=219182 RepID=UPI0004033FFE|nr:hypothetical protein [Ottowia thiooxydans]